MLTVWCCKSGGVDELASIVYLVSAAVLLACIWGACASWHEHVTCPAHPCNLPLLFDSALATTLTVPLCRFICDPPCRRQLMTPRAISSSWRSASWAPLSPSGAPVQPLCPCSSDWQQAQREPSASSLLVPSSLQCSWQHQPSCPSHKCGGERSHDSCLLMQSSRRRWRDNNKCLKRDWLTIRGEAGGLMV
jgi:hypothetical protein